MMIGYYSLKGKALKCHNSMHLTNGFLSESAINPLRGTHFDECAGYFRHFYSASGKE